MTAFVQPHGEQFGVEPICDALQVAPSAFWRDVARRRDPANRPARQRRDAELLAETINGLHKTELARRRAPRTTREAVESATLKWASWFNHHRALEPTGYIPPAEAEADYYRQLASQAMPA